MKLGARLLIAYAAVGLIFGATVVLTVQSQNRVIAESRMILEEDARVLKVLWDLSMAFDEAWRKARLLAATPSAELAREAERAREDVDRLINGLGGFVLPAEQAIHEELKTSWDDLRPRLARLETTASAGELFTREISPGIDRVTNAYRRFENERRNASEQRVVEIRETTATSRKTFAVFTVLLGLAAVLLMLFIRSNLLIPLSRLGQATEVIASGDLSAKVDYKADDEMGDLTERFNQMSQKLADTEKAKMEFLSMVSHDMRTPLTAISGYSGILSSGRRGAVTEKQIEALKIISNESDRLAFLVEDLLDAARAEAGAFRIEPKSAELSKALPPAIAAFERQAEAKKIAFTSDFSQLPRAVVDDKRLGQALRNLIGNAIKFTTEGGKVAAVGRVENNEIILEVRDTGLGIPPDNIERLFDRFYQVSKNAKGGLGLGLAIVKEIATAHGGSVEVESKIGEGTTFRIRIPYNQK